MRGCATAAADLLGQSTALPTSWNSCMQRSAHEFQGSTYIRLYTVYTGCFVCALHATRAPVQADGQCQHYKTGALDGKIVVKRVKYDSLGHLIQTYQNSPIFREVCLGFPVNAATTAALESAHEAHGQGDTNALEAAVRTVLLGNAGTTTGADKRPLPVPRTRNRTSTSVRKKPALTPAEKELQAKLQVLRKALLLETQIQSGAQHMVEAITHTLKAKKSGKRAQKTIQTRIEMVATEIANADAKIETLRKEIRLLCKDYWFGHNLIEFVRTTGQQSLVIKSCIYALATTGLREEGIFRIPGDVTCVEAIKKSFESAVRVIGAGNRGGGAATTVPLYCLGMPMLPRP